MDEGNAVQVESYTSFVRGVKTMFLFVSFVRESDKGSVSCPCLGSCSYSGSICSPWRGTSFKMEEMTASIDVTVSLQ